MKKYVYIVFDKGGYNDEVIDSVWITEEMANNVCKKINGYRVEKHEVSPEYHWSDKLN